MICKLFTALALLWLSFNTANAQDAPVKVNYVVASNKSVDFNFEKADLGTYTVVLTFTNLTNTYNTGRQEYEAKGYSGRLTTLTPSNKEQSVGFSYSYSYIRGKFQPKYDPNFVYLLPYKNGSKVKATESAFVNATYFGSTTPDDWKVYRFYTDNEDTVTAVRKGMVVAIKDLYETADGGVAYTSSVNELIIEHADGTLATYRGFKKGSFRVQVGQTVFPGTALGINSKSSGSGRPNIGLLITYLKSVDFEGGRNQNIKSSKSLYGFITPKFCTASNPAAILVAQQDYVSANTTEIIRKEFTKKELKQAGK
jgi:hypothetical protein